SRVQIGNPADLSNQWVHSHDPLRHIPKRPLGGAFPVCGGEGGIRTHGTVARTLDFESSPFDHSGTSPSFPIEPGAQVYRLGALPSMRTTVPGPCAEGPATETAACLTTPHLWTR